MKILLNARETKLVKGQEHKSYKDIWGMGVYPGEK